MKVKKAVELIQQAPFRLIFAGIRSLPLPVVLAIGHYGGVLAYYLMARRRRTAQANINAALGHELSRRQRRRAVKQAFINLGLNAVELLLSPRLNDAYFRRYTSVLGAEVPERLSRQNRGVVFLTAHFGNWEIASIIATRMMNRPLYALARQQKPVFLNNILNQYRKSAGVQVIEKGMALREMFAILRKQGMIGILGDQAGRQGVPLDFFGRSVFFADGAFRIAAATKSIIVPAFNVRSGRNHQLQFLPPIFDGAQDNSPEAVRTAMTRYRDLLEKYIRRTPGCWMWQNKRWKYTPGRRVLILDDARTGHLRQAEAVAALIREELPQTTVQVCPVAYAGRIRRAVPVLWETLLPGSCPWAVLRRCLTPQSAVGLSKSYADIVICTGSATRVPALWLGREHSARLISIMRPRPFPEKRFTLTILPEHDGLLRGRGRLITRGALHSLSPQVLAQAAQQIGRQAARGKNFRVGMLIGGSSVRYYFDPEQMRKLIDQVRRFCVEYDAELLFTASRRTDEDIVSLLHTVFDHDRRCVFRVFPRERNYSYAVGGILATCDCVLVSGESISMVSEAAGSGTPVLVFMPQRRGAGSTKHEKFIQTMVARRHVVPVDAETVSRTLEQVKSGAVSVRTLDDMTTVRAALKQYIL